MGIRETLDELGRHRPDRLHDYVQSALKEPYPVVQEAAAAFVLDKKDLRLSIEVVRAFKDLTAPARDLLRRHRPALEGALAALVHSETTADRESVFQFLAGSARFQDLSLLREGARDPSQPLADQAILAVRRLVLDFAKEFYQGSPSAKEFLDQHPGVVTDALDLLFEHYDRHTDTAVLQFAIEVGLADIHNLVFQRVLTKPQSRIYRGLVATMCMNRTLPALRLFVTLGADRTAAAQGLASEILHKRDDPHFAADLAGYLRSLSTGAFESLARRFSEIPWWGKLVSTGAWEPVDLHLHVQFLFESRVDDVTKRQRLKELLAHGNAVAREVALETFLARYPSEADAVAQSFLEDPDPLVIVVAAEHLDRRKLPGLARKLAPHIRSPHPTLSALALKVIARESFDRYMSSFDRLDPATRAAAARAISKIDPAMMDRLREEVQSLDADRRVKALQVAEYAHAAEQLRPVLREVLADPDVRVRATAIKIVQMTGGDEGIRLLIEALGDPDRRVRANAVEAFEAIGDVRYVEMLRPYLADPDNRVRGNAAKAVVSLGDPEGARALASMLEDENPLMRMSAAWAMGELGHHAFAEVLAHRLGREADPKVQERIRKALAELR